MYKCNYFIRQMKRTIKVLAKKICPKLYKHLQEYTYEKKKEKEYRERQAADPADYPKLLEKRYYDITGEIMDIYNPITYSQKIQWLKLFDPNPMRSILTDKVAVRDWIRKMIGEQYLVPIYGIYNSFDEIDFNSLPNRFVIKTNHSSGWNIVVKDKEKFNKKKAKKRFDKWMKMNYCFWSEFEQHYSSIRPKIIVEKYLEDETGQLMDYKFLCFDGKAEFVWIDYDRYKEHKRNVYDLNWNLQPWSQFTYGQYLPEGGVEPPNGIEEMIEIANKLSNGFIHVRVDLYNVYGKVYFGEMTFTNGSGFEFLYPKEYEKIIGNYIKLPINQ